MWERRLVGKDAEPQPGHPTDVLKNSHRAPTIMMPHAAILDIRSSRDVLSVTGHWLGNGFAGLLNAAPRTSILDAWLRIISDETRPHAGESTRGGGRLSFPRRPAKVPGE